MAASRKATPVPLCDVGNDLEDFQLPSKAKKSRFADPKSTAEMETLGKGPSVPNTEKSTTWAVRVFEEWRKQRNTKEAEEKCPDNLLEKPVAHDLNYWLARFVVEARRSDGQPYPASTIYLLLAGLLRYARSKTRDCPNFMDKKDGRFYELSGTCESVARKLRVQGVGANVKHAQVVTPEEEDQLWNSGTIGIFNPKVLLRAVFFYVGKAFCLRGGAEQRSLKPSQFVREYNPDRYTYTENGSKNHKGGFGTLHNSNKVVTVYATAGTDGDILRDVVFLLDKYLEKFPVPPSSLGFFYLQPRANVVQGSLVSSKSYGEK